MMNQPRTFVALVLTVVGLCGLPACSLPGNGNGNDNGNDNVDTDFAIFFDPDSELETNDVRDVDGRTIQFRLADETIMYYHGAELQSSIVWPVEGNFLGQGQPFQVRFGTEAGVRQAYFTETGPATICRYIVSDTTFSIAPTTVTVPQE